MLYAPCLTADSLLRVANGASDKATALDPDFVFESKRTRSIIVNAPIFCPLYRLDWGPCSTVSVDAY
jgi:hypothetical protein